MLLAVGAFLVSVAPGASAHHAPLDNLYPTINQGACQYISVCQTDNSSVTWFAYSTGTTALSAAARSNISAILSNQFHPTDLNVSVQSPPVLSGSGETDIVYERVALPIGRLGQARCNDPNEGTYTCDQMYVQFTSDGWGANPFVACHETGHAVGLLHGANADPPTTNTDPYLGCMREPYNSAYSATLGAHNVSQIDAEW
jgi:hypothetical protein